MKNIPKFKQALIIAVLIFTVAVLISCNKDTAVNPSPNAGILAFNLAPDRDFIGFAISGMSFTNRPVAYTEYTGGYQPIYPGTRTIEAYDFYSALPLAFANRNFESGHYYSAFLVGENGVYENIIAEDNLDSLDASANKAYIRYINATVDSAADPKISIAVNGGPVITQSAPYKAISPFIAVDGGSLEFKLTDEAFERASRTFEVEPNRVYTVLLVRDAASGSVEIRYIQNGNIVQ